ncbi:hypothetical protein OG272_01440 [Streptomyces sp. NBC_00104]|uniref:hypothetical protein n=1 Tax=unclassified Streptomyces TaxID=2593676 RepID=UPI003252A78A
MTNRMNRRTLLSTAAAVAGTAAVAPLLSACGGGGPNTGGTNTRKGLKAALPAHVPSRAVQPDIPSVGGGSDIATDPGFLNYPAQRPGRSTAFRAGAAATPPSLRCGAPSRPRATRSTGP